MLIPFMVAHNPCGCDSVLICLWISQSVRDQSIDEPINQCWCSSEQRDGGRLPVGMFPCRLLGFGMAWVGVAIIGIQPIWPARGCVCTLPQPCRVPSTGTLRIGTTHWRGQGSELSRRYLPLRAHRIFQQELSQQTRNFPNFFRGHSLAVTVAS